MIAKELLTPITYFLRCTKDYIHHTVPPELQIQHLDASLMALTQTYFPELLTNRELLYKWEYFVNQTEYWADIQNLNAKQITEYAAELLNNFYSEHKLALWEGSISLLHLGIFFSILTCMNADNFDQPFWAAATKIFEFFSDLFDFD